jgi:hypothetical protein
MLADSAVVISGRASARPPNTPSPYPARDGTPPGALLFRAFGRSRRAAPSPQLGDASSTRPGARRAGARSGEVHCRMGKLRICATVPEKSNTNRLAISESEPYKGNLLNSGFCVISVPAGMLRRCAPALRRALPYPRFQRLSWFDYPN